MQTPNNPQVSSNLAQMKAFHRITALLGTLAEPPGRSSLQAVRQRREQLRRFQRRTQRLPHCRATLTSHQCWAFIATALGSKAQTGTRSQPLLGAVPNRTGRTSPPAPPRAAPGTPRIQRRGAGRAARTCAAPGAPAGKRRSGEAATQRPAQHSAPQLRAAPPELHLTARSE